MSKLTLERFNEIVKQTGPEPTTGEMAAVSARIAEYETRTRHGGDDQRYADTLGMTVEEFARRFDDMDGPLLPRRRSA
ncbi:MAG: hypothetical protein ACRECW_18535 [Phyllobacterium sp.]